MAQYNLDVPPAQRRFLCGYSGHLCEMGHTFLDLCSGLNDVLWNTGMLICNLLMLSLKVRLMPLLKCGAHRLWCHRTYKAKLPLRIMLMIFDTLALQNDIYEWSRDHRVHHKYSDTDADPHNMNRGFFFSHMGWLCCKKHPLVVEKGKNIDLSDLDKDQVVTFQRAFYIPLVILIWGIIPTYVPHYFWGESLWNAFYVCVILRYVTTLNVTWCVNSFAHFYGMQVSPY